MTAPIRADPAPGIPTLVHPGPVAEPRVVAVPTRLTPLEIALPAGAPLLVALERLLARIGGRCAAGELVGGELAAASYFVPDVGPPGGPVATFSPVRAARAPARLVRGGLTVGYRDGAVFCHSHALFTDADGVERAGHLVPDRVVLGGGVRARVWVGHDVTYEVAPDAETTMPLFVPRRVAPRGDAVDAAGAVDAVVCRVRPNVDLVGAVLALTEEQGWAGADVRGQIGSLVGGRLGQPDGSVLVVDGPATEVVSLDGGVRRVGGQPCADLVAHLVDRHARVHGGRLLPGQNPVAMTYELVLTEA